ncbi:B12-binding domain-containing radical SAM protein [Candidatus Margulisiibacteriota bacterium]
MSRDSSSPKTCLLFPPQWTPFNPHFALYSLAGHLKSKNIDIDIYDVNLKFFRYLFSESYVHKFKDKLAEYVEELSARDQRGMSDKEKDKIQKITRFLGKGSQIIKALEAKVPEALNVFDDPELCYDPARLALASNQLEFYLKIFSIPYQPASIFLSFYHDPRYKMNLGSIIEIIESGDHFFEEYTQVFVESELIPKDYNFFAISINTDSQVLPGLLLAYKLRKHYGDSVHITIGGNYFTRLTDVIKEKKEFFTYFADSMIWGEGEIPFEKLVRAVESNGNMEEVPNLIYFDKASDSIKETFENPWIKNLDELGKYDLSKIPLKDYIGPEVTLPIQYSRGCYWGKCSFCDHFFGPKIARKSMDRLIEEIRIAGEYGVTKFVFIDEMLSPLFIKAFSERLLEESLHIEWFANGRTETGFTEEIMALASKAGLKIVMWGVESANRRIIELINKGVDPVRRFEALANADKAGIWNFAFIFFGFPTETIDEAFETIKSLSDPYFHIDSYGKSVFTPGKHSEIVKDPQKYGITELHEGGAEFATWYYYKTDKGMSRRALGKIADLCTKFYIIKTKNHPPVWLKFVNRDVLFLYLCKYGKDKVKNWRFKNPKALNMLNELPEIE